MDREYKNIAPTAAYVDDEDKVWSELRDERLYPRGEIKATFARTPFGTRAVGQSSKKFNFSMRLTKVPPGGKLIASSQKVLDLIEKKYALKGNKVSKLIFKKHKSATRPTVIRGRTFLYVPGVVKTRRAKVAMGKKIKTPSTSSSFAVPLGTPSTSPKRYSAVFTAPAAKAGRSSTAQAFNYVSAASHVGAHDKLLPPTVQPASSRRWEWLHLVGDALGGPTVAANLAAGTFDSNSRHNAIEEAVARASQTATGTDPLTYEVEADLIPGTEIATKFACRAKRPSLNSGAWVEFDPVDTLTTAKEDKVEDVLLRHAADAHYRKS